MSNRKISAVVQWEKNFLKKHSPLPWETKEEKYGDWTIRTTHYGKKVIGVLPSGLMEKADAAFIVTAVNAYAQNQEMIGELVQALRYELNYMEDDEHKKKIVALIAKAEGR